MIGSEVMPVEKKGFSGKDLKLIAIAAMTLDHLVWTVMPGYDTTWWVLLCHALGRVTAPIMWFFIAEGFFHTRNVKRYATRLFLLAVVSHFAYNFCFGISLIPLRSGIFNQTGVIWPLAWGLMLLVIHVKTALPDWLKLLLTLAICVITFPSDWSCVAAMAVLFMGLQRGNFRRQMLWMMIWTAVYAAVYVFFIDWVYGIVQLATCLSIPLLRRYNGTRGGSAWFGKLFYIYYPLHLALLGLLRLMIS